MFVYLKSENPTHSRRYLAAVQRDLRGGLVVVKRWGRSSAPGWQGSQTVEVAGPVEGGEVVWETLRRRRWNGYEVVGEG